MKKHRSIVHFRKKSLMKRRFKDERVECIIFFVIPLIDVWVTLLACKISLINQHKNRFSFRQKHMHQQ